MNWGGPPPLALVEHLLAGWRGHPIYVVALARPGPVQRRPARGAGGRELPPALPSAPSRPAPGALAALGRTDLADLEQLLAGLVRKELLGIQADPRSPEHGQYGFLQDLIRQVAYDTLSKRDRRAKHLASATVLAASLAEEEV